MNTPKALKALKQHFSTQEATAEALGVSQQAVSNWMKGKHGMNSIIALRAEKVTAGEIKAVWLCPELANI